MPGVALGVFYLLLRNFSFQFSQVDKTWTVIVVLLFLGVVTVVTLFALHRWAPASHPSYPLSDRANTSEFNYKVGEETVTFVEKMRTLSHDVVKVNAFTHPVGVEAEYAWIRTKYPNSKRIMQSLTTLKLMTGRDGSEAERIHFDVIKIELEDGREKEIYFDITSFFDGEASWFVDRQGFFGKRLSALYE